MEQTIIKLHIVNEHITGSGVSVGAVGSHDEVLLEMDFRSGALWQGTTRRAIFANALGENRTVIILTTNLLEQGQGEVYLVPVPWQAKEVAGECFLTVEGFVTDSSGKEIVRCVTEEARFRVLPSRLYTNDNAPVTPSQAEQLQKEVDSIKQTIVNAGISERNAKASELAAAASAAAAGSSADAAKVSADRAAAQIPLAQAEVSKAEAAAARSEAAWTGLQKTEVDAVTVPSAGEAAAIKTQIGDHFHIRFEIPRGTQGNPGPEGKQGKDGKTGPPGPAGRDAAVVAANGQYAFQVNSAGHLILTYTGDTAPNFAINSAGHLILKI